MDYVKIKVGNKTFKGTKSEILAQCNDAISMYDRIIKDGGRGMLERASFFRNGWNDVKSKLEAVKVLC